MALLEVKNNFPTLFVGNEQYEFPYKDSDLSVSVAFPNWTTVTSSELETIKVSDMVVGSYVLKVQGSNANYGG